MIITLMPFRADKNIGKAYNEQIELLDIKEDDWIIIRDWDSLMLTTGQFNLIEKLTKSDFDLIGAQTNRVGVPEMLKNVFDNNHDIRNHVYEAKKSINKFGSEIIETELVPGYFMMFPLRTWNMVGGFREGSIREVRGGADTMFSKDIWRAGGKVGLAKGLYLYHMYRIENCNFREARRDNKHLK